MQLTASLIVRNEEATLGDCLSSLRGQVDEIVVVDTGSEDGTRAVAARHGAVLLDFPWVGDFAAARNFALDACSGDWILYIDADECMAPLPPGAIKQALQPGWIAANVLLRPRPRHTPYLLARLFRRHPAIRFEGRIHETVIPSIAPVAGREGLVIGDTELLIEHRGYEGDLSAKHARNLPLLHDAVRSMPERVYYWHHLAETLAALGRFDEARSAAARGIAAAAANPTAKSLADAAMLHHLLARTDLEAGHDPLPVLAEGLRQSPDNHALRLLLAQRHLAFGQAGEALRIAESLLEIDPATLAPGFLSYNEDIFGSFALRLKASSLVRLGRIEEAARATARLLSGNGG